MPKKQPPPADYECYDCHSTFAVPDDVDRLEFHCPACEGARWGLIKTAPIAIAPPKDSGWQLLNGGRGMFMSGLGRRNDPKAYCRSLREATEKAKKLCKSYEIS